MPLEMFRRRPVPTTSTYELVVGREAQLAVVQRVFDTHVGARFEDLARATLDVSRSFHGMAANDGELAMLVPLMTDWIRYTSQAGRLTADHALRKLNELLSGSAL